MSAGQGADRIENGRYVFAHDFALNLQKFKSQLDERNMVKAGDVYYKLNQLDDKYKGILNFHEEIVIDIPDGKYEAIYLLGSIRCSNLIKKNIKVKYSDGTEETLSLGQQVHYDAEENPTVSGSILPFVFTCSLWVKNGEIRGDWFGGGAYSHSVKPKEDKIITSIILPKTDKVTEAFDTYAITLKYADEKDNETIRVKNLTGKDIYLNIIESGASAYKISDLNIKANENINTSVNDKVSKVFFWDIRTLKPYANAKNE